MIITLTRSGGFTGIPFKKTVDTTNLPKEKAQEIETNVRFMIDDLRLNQKKSPGKSSMINNISSINKSLPDQFTYMLSIHNQVVAHDIIIAEKDLDETIHNLITLLQQI